MSVSLLCQSCGLCCQGALFRYALLSEEEALDLQALGLPTHRRRDGTKALRLGCAGLRGTRCGLYERRPQACRVYLCALAMKVREDTRALEQASKRVAEAQTLLREIAMGLPPAAEDDPPSLMERAYQVGLKDGPEPLRRAEALFSEYFLTP